MATIVLLSFWVALCFSFGIVGSLELKDEGNCAFKIGASYEKCRLPGVLNASCDKESDGTVVEESVYRDNSCCRCDIIMGAFPYSVLRIILVAGYTAKRSR